MLGLGGDVLDASVPPASRCPSPGYYVEPGDSREYREYVDETQDTRYALNQNVLWGVFQHKRETLDPEDFGYAVIRLVALCQQGLESSFDQFVDRQIRQIIRAAKQQGQSFETTLQTLDRFYREGLMGEMESSEQTEEVLAQWQRRLERLWSEVEP